MADNIQTFFIARTELDLQIGNFNYGGGRELGFGFKNKYAGINIVYFGDNCYHLDYYVNGKYEVTGRSCLSMYELYHITIKKEHNQMLIKLHLDNEPFFKRSIFFLEGKSFFCGFIMNDLTILKIKV